VVCNHARHQLKSCTASGCCYMHPLCTKHVPPASEPLVLVLLRQWSNHTLIVVCDAKGTRRICVVTGQRSNSAPACVAHTHIHARRARTHTDATHARVSLSCHTYVRSTCNWRYVLATHLLCFLPVYACVLAAWHNLMTSFGFNAPSLLLIC